MTKIIHDGSACSSKTKSKPNQSQIKQETSDSKTIRTIQADINKVKGSTCKVWRKCVGAGRANEGLRTDWQEHLRQVKKECGFIKYL